MKKRIVKLDPLINPNTFFDGRGGIMTYLPERFSIVEWNYIVTLKGSVRGDHLHKEFDEYILVTDGEGLYTELTDGERLTTYVSSGDCIYIPMNVPHTFYPSADTKFIALLTKRWDDCDEPITKVVV